jgi:hypothetical protein
MKDEKSERLPIARHIEEQAMHVVISYIIEGLFNSAKVSQDEGF